MMKKETGLTTESPDLELESDEIPLIAVDTLIEKFPK